MFESLKQNINSTEQKPKKKKIIGGKELAIIAGLGMFNKGDKVSTTKIETEKAKITEIKKSLERSLSEDSTKVITKEDLNRVYVNPDKENIDETTASENVVENKVNPAEVSYFPEIQDIDKTEQEPSSNTNYSIEKEKKSFSQERTAEETKILFDDLLKGLKKEHGILAGMIKGKLNDHKDEIVEAIYSVNQFKKENQKYFTILDNTYWFSENPEIRNGQINTLGITYELYQNGSLKKISDPGLLVNIYSKFSGENLSLYKEIKNSIEKYNELPLSEKQEWVKEIEQDAGVAVTIEEMEHIIILCQIATVMEDFMSGLEAYKDLVSEDNFASRFFKKLLEQNPTIHKSLENFKKEITKI